MPNYEKEIKKIFENGFNENYFMARWKGKLSPEQLDTLRRYKEYYEIKPSSKGGVIKPASLFNSLMTLRNLGLFLKKPFEDARKQNIIGFFSDCQKKGLSVATTSAWKVTIRSLYKWMYATKICEKCGKEYLCDETICKDCNFELSVKEMKKHEFPLVVDDKLLEPEKAPPRKISPGDLFTKDEVVKLVDACIYPQDKAIVNIWYEMGLRAKEYVSANVDSVEFVPGGAKLYIEESKTENGWVPLIMSAEPLREWLEQHPFKDNPKAPLFIGLHAYFGRRLRPSAISDKLKRIAKRAGINKRIFTHLGRNISITRLDGELSTEDNARIHGITSGTVLDVYTRRNRKDACNKYFNTYGKKTDDEKAKERVEKEKLMPKTCVNCGETNSFDRKYCKKCLRPVDLATALKIEDEKSLREQQLQDRMNGVEQAMEKMAQNLQQPIRVPFGDKQAMVSTSGLSVFGQEFKSWKKDD